MTTPHQGAPDGAVTVGGSAWNYGQLVNENRAREQFELEPPSNLAEALDLLPTVLHTIPHEGMRSWQKWLGSTDDEVKDGTVVQQIIDSLDKHPLRKLKNRLFHGLNGDDDPDDDPTDTDIYNAAAGLNTGINGSLNDIADVISSGSNLIRNAGFERGVSHQATQGIFSNDTAYSGSSSLKMTSDGAGKSYNLLTSGITPLTILALGDDKFYVEVYVKGAATNVQATGGVQGIRFCMSPKTNTGSALADQFVYLNSTTALNGVWTKLSGLLTMPANTHKVDISLQLTTAVANGSIFYFDSVVCREVTLAQQAKDAAAAAHDAAVDATDAATTATGAATDATNAANAATGAATDATTAANTAGGKADAAVATTYDIIESGSNIIKNSNFERGSAFTGGTFVTTPAFAGSSSLRLTATGALLSYPLHTDGLTPKTANAKEGDVFLLEVMVYGATSNTQTTGGAAGVKFSMSPVSRAGATLSKQYVALTASTALNGAWTKLSGFVTMPTDAVKAYVYLELDTTVTTGQIYYFDQAVCREVTVAKAAETTALGAVDFSEDIVASGSNVIKNSDFERSFSVQPTQGVFSTDITAYSGTNTLKMTSDGVGKDYALMTSGSTPKSTPANDGDIFYVEAQVWGASTNTQTSGGTAAIRLNIAPTTRVGAALTNQYVSLDAGTALKGVWTKMSGYIVMPATTARAKISLQLTSAVTSGNIYYWDNIIVREVTVAKGAKDDVQTVVDGVVQAVDGGAGTGTPSTVKTKLQTAWARIFDGLAKNPINTTSTATSTNMHAAGFAAKTQADLGVSNAASAAGQATTVGNNLQTVTDGVVQAVDGGSGTGTPALVKTKLQTAWGRIFDGLAKNPIDTTAASTVTSSNLHAAGFAAKTQADLGVTNAGLASGSATTVSNNLQTVVDGVIQAVDGGTGTGTASVVKTKLQTAWANIFDGMSGNAINTTTSATPSQVHTASKAVKDTVRDTVDGIVQAVDGGSVANNTAATAKARLQKAWGNIFDGLSKNAINTTPTATAANMHAAGFSAKTQADLGVGNASLASGAAAVADGKAVTADTLSVLSSSQNGIVLSPDFEDSGVRRYVRASGSLTATATYTTAQVKSGAQSLQLALTSAGAAGDSAGIYLNPVTSDASPTLLRIPVMPGQVYNYDVFVFSKATNVSNKQLTLAVDFATFASPNSLISGTFMTAKNQTKGSWDRWTGTYTVPATVGGSDPIYMVLYFVWAAGVVGVAGDTAYLDRCLIWR